ncbi:hypothetical protein OQE61_06670 [Cetobacterium somerae]|uniref:toxin-antitoxin system YwqK family antitoxin n=1 Tax=Cetobacterium somerae TaxID=188913 RepID=UPI00225369DF|nr:hypothetical protein [Cetobacterium somerae]MCX3067173.1 hypothetical protein [Cetobacterium somerae]
MKRSYKKLIIGICITIFIFLTSFTSKIKRREGYIGVYPSLNFEMSSNSSEGTLYIVLGMTLGPLAFPVYIVDRTSSFIYDTILFPVDAYKEFRANNGKIIKYYEDEFRVEWVGRGKIKSLYTDKKRLEYTLKNGKYVGEYYEYFEDGSIKEFSNWKDGKLDGVKKTYYSPKEIQTDEVWKDNQLISLVYYDFHGKILIKIFNDIPLNRFLKEEYEYLKDVTIVQVLKYDSPIVFDINGANRFESGTWIKTQNFKNNRLVYEVMDTYDGDKRTGFKEVEYSENGDIIYECVLSEEEENELYKKFYKLDN